MEFPADLLYNESHEWIRRLAGGSLEVGITDFAQEELGDLVFAEPPDGSVTVEQSQTVCSLESVKAVSEVYAPVSGTVSAFNEALEAAPELINTAPYTDGWLFRMQPSDLSQLACLLSAEDYRKLIAANG